jgi:transcriptional regulator with XRE-family HTH domain
MSSQSKRSTTLTYFGRQVAFYRKRAGMTQAEVADLVDGYGLPMLKAVEQGIRAARPELIIQLDRITGADGALLAGAEHIAEVNYPAGFGEQANLERDCVWLHSYVPNAIPGLLQTEGYARSVINASAPALDDDEVDRLVRARIERQELLTRRPPATLSFVVEEHSLRRPIGGRDVLRGQLDRLTEVAALRNVSVQVMPTDVDEHTGLDGPIVLLETAKRRTLAYIEGQLGGEHVADPEEVSVLAMRYGIIRSQALTSGQSADLIKQIAGEL